MRKAVGHVDYYPNGGEDQPNCNDGRGNIGACSHSRAQKLFLESITSDCYFCSQSCENYETFQTPGQCQECWPNGCGIMGYNSDKSDASGKQYLETSNKKPYCIPADDLGIYSNSCIFNL